MRAWSGGHNEYGEKHVGQQYSRRLRCLAGGSLVIALLLIVHPIVFGQWALETVDSLQPSSTALAMSGTGELHMAYARTSTPMRGLWHARRDGGTWKREQVDTISSSHVSLALDDQDHSHISYYDSTNRNLKYAHYDGTQWHTETVDSSATVGRYTSIALDSSGRPHISYYDGTNESLKYARNDGMTWHTETVDSDGSSIGRAGTSIAVDSFDRPRISYSEGTFGEGELRYACYDGTTWHITRVDVVDRVGGYSSIVLDSAERPHISYRDGTNHNLKYAWYDGTDWHMETVDATANVGEWTSIAVDSEGHPHISYYDSTNRNLKYAHHNGAKWVVTTADADGNVGDYTSIALDAGGSLHIAYRRSTDTSLRYATAEAPVELPDEFQVRRETGDVLTPGAFYGSGTHVGGADLAEWVSVTEPVEPGHVLEIDPTGVVQYRLAQGPCTPSVAGVVSTQPGMILGHTADTDGRALLALLGVVPVKVTDEGGPIATGDLLIVSSTPGYAMRWDPDSGMCGLVGKALEPHEEGEGVIEVLLTR